MIFWLLLAIIVLSLIVPLAMVIYTGDKDDIPGALAVSVVACAIPITIVLGVWSSHADDLATLKEYQGVVEIREERVNDIRTILSNYQYPEKPTISMDKDFPWAETVKRLDEAHKKYAEAKEYLVEAKRSIEGRKYGPFSGVVTLMGDRPE